MTAIESNRQIYDIGIRGERRRGAGIIKTPSESFDVNLVHETAFWFPVKIKTCGLLNRAKHAQGLRGLPRSKERVEWKFFCVDPILHTRLADDNRIVVRIIGKRIATIRLFSSEE